MTARRWLAAALLLLSAGASHGVSAEAPKPAPCPQGAPAHLTCLRGQDANGAHLLLARPANWNGGLVTHVFGGPRMAPIRPETTDEDLLRFAEYVADGWAWVSTSRRRPGFGIRQAGEDALSARRIAEASFGRPRIAVIHGQSWGGAISARAIETLNHPDAEGRRPWQGALLTSAVLAGPTRAYDMRVDLRAAFQVICGTHPGPQEPQYPVTLGLPRGERMAWNEIMARYTACTGSDLAQQSRSPAQRRALADLVAVTRIPAWSIPTHMAWATNVFADIAWNMMDGRSAFGNAHVRYQGTSDDAAFNARVPRIAPDPDAQARLAEDGDPTGAIAIPVLTLHGIEDATVFVEHQAAYRATLERAGTAHLLQQVFVEEEAHNKMSAPLYPAAMAALRGWVETGHRPTVEEIRRGCEAARARHPGPCRIRPGYVPQPWEARVNPR
ncbi:hypothetical protein [Falsiroseomonas tokyonensis]|uniref:Alpha/beta hydrolase n=1 Tax=Falsiroseomonas tokyonensis TaxID=430521 RepID=A0ABV7C174_9PROT|nr:hypothetical protein [Falsiroseomonas tokyonensis]MBU8540698.1 hypothetical protein [Falsiroseomonas tokyonensis]